MPGLGQETALRELPRTKEALVLRTDFADNTAREQLCSAIQAPVGEFRAYLEFLSDPEYEGLTVEDLPKLMPTDSDQTFMFVVDQVAVSHPEHPILVVDLSEEPGRTFRVIPSEMWSVENNLSIANMGSEEFAEAVDPDGVFRGFAEG